MIAGKGQYRESIASFRARGLRKVKERSRQRWEQLGHSIRTVELPQEPGDKNRIFCTKCLRRLKHGAPPCAPADSADRGMKRWWAGLKEESRARVLNVLGVTAERMTAFTAKNRDAKRRLALAPRPVAKAARRRGPDAQGSPQQGGGRQAAQCERTARGRGPPRGTGSPAGRPRR